jgi:hypothetical protein
MSTNIWSGPITGSHSNGKYFIISNYFGQNAPYEFIEYNSSVEFAAAGVYAQDLDGDNQEEILIFSNNVHQINTFGGGVYIGDTSNPPEELGTVILKIDNNFNLLSENIVGTPKAIHRGSSGDIDILQTSGTCGGSITSCYGIINADFDSENATVNIKQQDTTD